MTTTAAILLNYNSSDYCVRCIAHLKKQADTNLKIIVVDNQSTEDVTGLEQACADNGCIFIQSGANGGYNAGNNVGLRRAASLGCDYAMIINPDMEIRDEHYVKDAVAIMDADPSIAVLGTDIIDMDGLHQNPMREPNYREELLWPIELVRNKIKKRLYMGDSSVSGYCRKVSGCCLFVRMDFIDRVGYFDEHVFLYCEEPILAATVAHEGLHEYYCADLKAYHMHIESEKGDPRRRLAEFHKSRVYYLETYSGYRGLALNLLLLSKRLQHKWYQSKKH
ncbi:glycosyltransferase family 2 protein [Bifidobacterium miconisargentati]|uniref:glycosyltransferase family 2 protein n=1 Tax=Bifidobacterium miconisargentati TaxID=2834437 RepID=UPI001BDDA49C|nr:glycosyltransferase family 2 protein [Bifidobacterium miconisargentati]MBW3090921.1 glycosyltransferase family 2 protein [Bifidobacterium miconisargentati]